MKKQIIALIAIFAISTIIAENPLGVTLPEGKSNMTVSEDFPSIYASDLIEQNPQIQSITMQEYGQTFGYLNTLGGIGTNFLIQPSRNYEIYVNESITIELKY